MPLTHEAPSDRRSNRSTSSSSCGTVEPRTLSRTWPCSRKAHVNMGGRALPALSNLRALLRLSASPLPLQHERVCAGGGRMADQFVHLSRGPHFCRRPAPWLSPIHSHHPTLLSHDCTCSYLLPRDARSFFRRANERVGRLPAERSPVVSQRLCVSGGTYTCTSLSVCRWVGTRGTTGGSRQSLRALGSATRLV